MKLCRVLGPVVATKKHPAWEGMALLCVQPLDEKGEASGAAFLAVDRAQAGEGDVVLVLSEGTGVRQIIGNPQGPIRSAIVGIVDEVHVP
ncbi:MAG: EutN/CcmL family microcompartment protein [Deltaproteobacteria bacterium]|nr:EutN/CcmL family microcompartment protein [Deltaproteobacteria bacterium]